MFVLWVRQMDQSFGVEPEGMIPHDSYSASISMGIDGSHMGSIRTPDGNMGPTLAPWEHVGRLAT